jgi:4-hydroxybenzoate polyprenyltransferase
MSDPSTGATHAPARTDSTSLVRYLLALSRPRFWLYLAGPALVGVVWAASAPGDLLALPAVATLAYFLLPANLFLYGVNDRYDAPIDESNPRKGEAGPEVQYRADRRVTATVQVSGLLAIPLVLVVPPLASLAVLAFVALSIAYSAPPVRLKTRPPLDSVSNGLYVLPGIVGYVAVAGEAPPLLAVLAGWLWTMAMHTFSAIPDVEPDRVSGVATTATVLGERGALAYCVGCWLAATVLGALHAPGMGLLFAVYPVFGAAIGVVDVPIDRAYAWFPAVNGLVGMTLTLAGLWRVVGGW